MVPWHPPCALISLIFSSLDPETNCLFYLRMPSEIFRFLAITPLATGLIFESFLVVQLSRYRTGLSTSQTSYFFRSTNPENDTEPSTLGKQYSL